MKLRWLTSYEQGDDGLAPAYRLPALCSVLLGTLLVVLDSSMMSVALPSMGVALHVHASSSIWISNAYQLIAASLILSCAAFADRVGSKRLYLSGLILFVFSSLWCALAWSFESLVAARALQGVGAAAVMSLGPSLNRRIFPTRVLGSAIGMVAMAVAVALAAGPTMGGVILSLADWRWLFFINLPVGGTAIWMAWRSLPDERGNGKPFDVVGAALSVIMLGMGALGLGSFRQGGSHCWAFMALGVAFVALAGFVCRQQYARHPLLPLSMFREPRFSLAAITSLFSFIAQTMALLSLPFLLQTVQGYSPLVSGLLFTPWPLAIMLAAPWSGYLADRFSPTKVASGGLVLFSLGILSLALLAGQSHVTAIDILWRSALCGIGFGFFQSPNNRELMGSLARELSSRASGVQATVRTFAQSVGAALVALALSGVVHVHSSTLPVGVALWWAAALVLMALMMSLGRIAFLYYWHGSHVAE